MLTLTPTQLTELLVDPGVAEEVAPIAGAGLLVVGVGSEREADRLPRTPGAGLPAVVVALGAFAGGASTFADLVLSDSDADEHLDAVARAVEAHPVAAVSLAVLLRRGPPSAVPAASDEAVVEAGLAAESAVFSMLLAGAEFARWRAQRPRREPPVDDEPRVRITRAGTRLEVVLTRPGRHNALDRRMRDALVEALAVGLADPALTVRLSGAGPSFCAGGDLDEFGSYPDPATAHVIRLARSPALLMHRLATRTEVFVHGACLGAGVELPAFASRVVATEDAVFALPEVAMGLVPGAGGTVSLPRRIGRHRTALCALAGLRLDVATAHEWGLVDDVVRH